METIRARCPGCQKLYGVDPKDIKDQQPEFLCRKCGQKFYFNVPSVITTQEVQTFLKDPTQVPPTEKKSNTKMCPKCKSENPVSNETCLYCGIIFEKFGKKREEKVSAPTNLKAEWDNLLANYEKIEVHEKFISDCLAQKQLTYASAQYRKMLEANPSDTIALKMRDKIIGLATVSFIPPKRDLKQPPRMNFLFLFSFLSLIAGILGTIFRKLQWMQPVGFSLFLVLGGMLAYKYYKARED